MMDKVRTFGMVALLGMLGVTTAGRCCAEDLPPQPVPVLTDATSAPVVLTGPPAPGAVGGVAPPACAPYEDRNGPLLRGDPLLDRPDSPPPGWFVALDLGIVASHVNNGLVGTVTFTKGTSDLTGYTDTVQLPSAGLDWTAAPHLELGYRFPEGFGEFVFGYQSLATSGHGMLANFDLDGSAGLLSSRVDTNVIDLDYASREYSLGASWDMKWRAGLRLASVFFDTQAVGQYIEQRSSNDYFGAGPHVGLDLWHQFPGLQLGLFSRLEGSALLGNIRQEFDENVAFDESFASGTTVVRGEQAVPALDVQVGVAWTPSWGERWVRFAVGYEFQQWWYLGQVGGSHADLQAQGVFLRGEWGF